MWRPSVDAGILRASDLVGWRNGDIFIRNSLHVPPAKDAVRDVMPVFFELLAQEAEPSVRAVLGHFIFVYIHPYMDGNGRLARFLMNAMLSSGGWPWTIITLESRTEYMTALESASAGNDIGPFADFICGSVSDQLNPVTVDHQQRQGDR